MIRSGPTDPATAVVATSAGSISAEMMSWGSPVARISSRSMLLRSWRTLPGQSCTCRVAMASSPRMRLGMPVASLMRSMK